MKTFKEFVRVNGPLITEELHKELQNILDSDESDEERQNRLQRNPWQFASSDPRAKKLTLFTKRARELIKNGQDTGLENDKPKKGSSRAVFFPKEERDAIIDGTPSKLKTAIKIAFPGSLDRYKKNEEDLLGQMQNRVEADHFTRHHYGMLRENDDNTFSTNENGVLAPVLSNHPDHHYLEMGHVNPITETKFRELTKTDTHPKGLKFKDMFNAINKEYNDAHGQSTHLPEHHNDEYHDHLMSHPFLQNLYDMVISTGNHPGDINRRNMGVWTHPVTKKEYPVISDYGFSNDVAKAYSVRRFRIIFN